jgi:threonine 3-dehydrogenase
MLITGVSGEIGRSLLRLLSEAGRYDVVTLDLAALPDELGRRTVAAHQGSITDRALVGRLEAEHSFDAVVHLAALLSTSGEKNPALAHQVNVDGTLHLLQLAQRQSARAGRPVRFVFPSTIAVYGLPDLATKARAGRVKEEEHNAPTTMYGCNKLYCEHLGRYFARHARPIAHEGGEARDGRIDFRALRYPGIISADTVPSGGTSDFGPEMLHAAAKGKPYACFVGPSAKIPFMAMPDAVKALVGLLEAPAEKLSTCVYNVGAFAPTAEELAERVRKEFPKADLTTRVDPQRAAIVDSWPEDVDDGRARADWGWEPEYGFERAMGEYLVPGVRGG